MEKINDSIVKSLLNDPYFHKLLINPDKACQDFWENWADVSEERQACIENARALLLSFEFSATTVSQQEKDNLWDQITEQIDQPTSTGRIDKLPSTRNWWYGVAASLLVVVTFYFIYINNLSESIQVTEEEVSFIEKVAPEGKISSFTFEDGTTVKLFSGSVIRYPIKFSNESREVYLEGEGFFEVTKDSNRPFTVNTNTLKTTALGTSFNIRTYQNNTKCDVSLVSGIVKVETQKNYNGLVSTLFLEPGEEAIMEFEDVMKRPFNIKETVSWKDGYVYLEDKSFDETISILKRWFKVDFVVNNRLKVEGKLKEKKGNGTFKNQSLENILKVIGHSFEFKYEIQHDTVILTF